jgi:prepilin-type N-terminal cleavage/methylation domain-containing protein
MHSHNSLRSKQAFTLIELLVVIAIIAILAVVVVLTLNPAEMLRQARDSNRLSDLATINSALNMYTTDQSGSSGFSLGNASNVYLSLPDTSNMCSNLGLATTSPSSITYACATSTSSRNINTSGWIPVNLSLISSGSPLGSLPIDPVNQSSSGLYYTYYTNGQQFEVTSLFESQKNKASYGKKPIVQSLPELNAQGSSLSINPLFNPTGLVGYWPMDEGSGSSTQDLSGNNNGGTWSGTAAGTNSTYYSAGQVGSWAGMFDGSADYVNIPNVFATSSQITMSAWADKNGSGNADPRGIMVGIYATYLDLCYQGHPLFSINTTVSGQTPVEGGTCASTGAWTNYVGTYDGLVAKLYVNGLQVATTSVAGSVLAHAAEIGASNGTGMSVNGLIDDVRIYNRALSAAEIQALYNAEK